MAWGKFIAGMIGPMNLKLTWELTKHDMWRVNLIMRFVGLGTLFAMSKKK